MSISWRASDWSLEVRSRIAHGTHQRAYRTSSSTFSRGVAFSTIGARFSARAHRYPSRFSVTRARRSFPMISPALLCLLNSARAQRYIVERLIPRISFQVGDVNRLPIFHDRRLPTRSSTDREPHSPVHESHREPSVEFKQPGPPWRHAQDWAQAAVDRPEGAPLPTYDRAARPRAPHRPPELRPRRRPRPLRRRTARASSTRRRTTSRTRCPHGILFLDGTLDDDDRRDSLGHPAARHSTPPGPSTARRSARALGPARLAAHSSSSRTSTRACTRTGPIHWPLSSAKKTFVAWVTIHRWTEQTLRVLLADHLDADAEPARRRARPTSAPPATAPTRRRPARPRSGTPRCRSGRDELAAFIAAVEQCAEQGPPPTDAKCPPRERRPLRPRPRRRRDDQQRRPLAAARAAVEGPEEVVEGARHRQGQEGLRLVAPRDALLADAGRREVPGRTRRSASPTAASGSTTRPAPGPGSSACRTRSAPTSGSRKPPTAPAAATWRPGDGPTAPPSCATMPTRRSPRSRRKPSAACEAARAAARARAADPRDRASGRPRPEACWELELRLAEKQGASFRLLAPDEPEPAPPSRPSTRSRSSDAQGCSKARAARRAVRRGRRARTSDDEEIEEDEPSTTAAKRRPAHDAIELGPVSATLEADLRTGSVGTGSCSGSTSTATTRASSTGSSGCGTPARCPTRSAPSAAVTWS